MTFLNSISLNSFLARPQLSIEKNLGNEDFLPTVVGFRTKPRTLTSKRNHICPFILTVQTLAAPRAVSNILIATWSGGCDISVVILLISTAEPWPRKAQ